MNSVIFAKRKINSHQSNLKFMSKIVISKEKFLQYRDVYTPEVLNALQSLSWLNAAQKALMEKRNKRRQERVNGKLNIDFLPDSASVNGSLTVSEIRKGNFKCSEIPHDLKRQWIQGTGPGAKPNTPIESSIRNVAYALLSGADGWMFDGEDAQGKLIPCRWTINEILKLQLIGNPYLWVWLSRVAQEMNKWAEGFSVEK
jgi:malate synthase